MSPVFGKYGRYPHMIGYEVVLWDRFLDKYRTEYDKFQYDVHVGKPPEEIAKYPPNIRAAIEAVSLFRIDSVGYRPDGITLFEVKEYAAVSALGQLLCYQFFYARDKLPARPLHMAVVSDRIGEDMQEVFKKYNVSIYLV